jgi:hypothetical protein
VLSKKLLINFADKKTFRGNLDLHRISTGGIGNMLVAASANSAAWRPGEFVKKNKLMLMK